MKRKMREKSYQVKKKEEIIYESLPAGVQGFEPQLTDPESAVLPLNDTPLLWDVFSSTKGILHDVAPVVKSGLGYFLSIGLD